MAKAIMVQGTMSNVGKSLLVAGLCRVFSQDGYKVAPFKSQNMALNSFVTREGLEMGRAQVMQAQAARITPSVRMNPVLLKPTSEVGSQVIVEGEVVGNMAARDYFSFKKELFPKILSCYESLSREVDILVIEGAGSPAEINLKQDDIVNMGLARRVGAPVLLLGDIDRGGVFAQLYGTLALLEKEEQALVRGLVINKFRGDKSLLDSGIQKLEALCHRPVVGCLPYLPLSLEDEDSLSGRFERKAPPGRVDLVVIRTPRISNFTDFDPLEGIPGVSLRYVSGPREFGTPDLILLPGSKNTLEDLRFLRESGLEGKIQRRVGEGALLIGICGGFQMLGAFLSDPEGVEGREGERVRGLGLLPMETVFTRRKIRTQVEGRSLSLEGTGFAPLSGVPLEGYEIHMGESFFLEGKGWETDWREKNWRETAEEESSGRIGGELKREFFLLKDEVTGQEKRDGVARGNVMGTYLHGLFDKKEVVEGVLRCLHVEGEGITDRAQERERQFDLLAQSLRENLDLEFVYDMLGLESRA